MATGAQWDEYIKAVAADQAELVVDHGPAHTPRYTLRGSTVDDTMRRNRFQLAARRLFDVAVASVSLLLLAPVCALSAAVIWATSPGPILFRQYRVGRNGELFSCLKFRTMFEGSEAVFVDLVARNAQFRGDVETLMKPTVDTRITRPGTILRRHSIDELPQLVNVLRGEMSIVGPRPFLPAESVRFGRLLPQQLAIKPGLTGLWQVSGRNGLTFDDRVLLDAEYIGHNSLAGDIAICIRTIPAVLYGSGAR